MTPIVRTFALVFAALGVIACTEDAPATQLKPKTQAASKHAPKLPAPGKKTLDAPAFTSVVDPQPPSLLAQKAGEKEPAKEDDKKDDKALSAPNAEAPKTVDYDRPLSADEVHVTRFVLAHDVMDREPLDESDVFTTETEQIFAFVELENATGEPYAFRVHFEPAEGPEMPYGVKLTVNTSPRYRTWAWTKIRRAKGRYRAVLRTLDGEEIASREFDIDADVDFPRYEDLEYESDL